MNIRSPLFFKASQIIVSLRSTFRRVAAAAAAAAITGTGAHRDYHSIHIRVYTTILFTVFVLNLSYMFTALFFHFQANIQRTVFSIIVLFALQMTNQYTDEPPLP